MKITIMNGKPHNEIQRLPDNMTICDDPLRGQADYSKSKCLMAEGVLSSINFTSGPNESKTVAVIGKNEDTRKCKECSTAREDEREPAYYCAKDMVIQISTTCSLLQTGWYYENFSSQEAKSLLRKEPVGTFLIRDSSDPKYLYSLSVKTSRGTTSVRILYHKGQFQLDSDERISAKMPKFDSAVRLVDFYARLTSMGRSYVCRWLESSGRKDLPIVLQKPKSNCVVDLKQLCRLSINRSLPKTLSRSKVLNYVDKLPVPKPIKNYLKEYPYIH
ncbi:suppressor of cytokine signaling 2-like [Saccostrea cucullata]|uniref:suppressor of cytokine signaling 2-like n=1 Tax=Saccostrea cuccullata TaxID=36930 RepID=UPI002ED382B9